MPVRLMLLLPLVAFVFAVSLGAAPATATKDAPVGQKPAGGRNVSEQPAGDRASDSKSRPSESPVGKGGKPKPGKTPAVQLTYASVVKERPGQQTLVINYRWKVHDKASIEVRLVPAERAEKATVSPLYFFGDYFRGPVREKVYRCFDHAERGVTDSFKKDKMEFKIIGQRNSSGRPTVIVLPFNPESPSEAKDKEAWDRPTIVFPLLEPWAVNDGLLTLDLPREVSYKAELDEFERRLNAFSRPGKLYVWFLRGDKVLWENMLDWPGY